MRTRHIALAPTLAAALLLATTVAPVQAQSAPAEAAAEQAQSTGEKLFNATCATCHSVQPPANLAPPMAMIMQHYRKALDSDEAIRTTVMEWVVDPAKERSLMPAMAIEHHGLMPPITTLSNDELHEITTYLLTLKPEKGGMGMGGGQGMRHGKKDGQGMQHGKKN